MNVIFEKNVLCEAVAPLMGAVSNKNTIAAVEGILLTTDGFDKCVLTSFDLDKGFCAVIDAEVKEAGSYVINGNKFNQIIRTLPEGKIQITVNNRFIARITGGKSEFELNALSGDEFPSIPEFRGEYRFRISQSVFRNMLSDTCFAVAQNESKAVLNGSYFRVDKEGIRIVACDGNRLAIRDQSCSFESSAITPEGKEFKLNFILPGKAVNELLKNLKDTDGEVTVALSRKNAIFDFGSYVFFSRLIEGQYLEYERFIPKENRICAIIKTEEFIRSLERASLVSDDKSLGQAKSYVKCSFSDEILSITSASANGKAYDELTINKTGNDLEIGFNCRFLLDALRACGTEEVKCQLNTPLSCMVITPTEKSDDSDYLYLVLPIKMKE